MAKGHIFDVLCVLVLLTTFSASNGCLKPEQTSDGAMNKTCIMDDQCSLGFKCNVTINLCCRIFSPIGAHATWRPFSKLPDVTEQPLVTKSPILPSESEVYPQASKVPPLMPIRPIFNPINPIEGGCPLVDTNPDGTIKKCSSNAQCKKMDNCINNQCCGRILEAGQGDMSNFKRKRNQGCPAVEDMPVSDCFGIHDNMRCKTDGDCLADQVCCNSGCGKICTKAEKRMTPCERQFKLAAVQLVNKKDLCTPVFIPRCDKNGNFTKKQCLESHGICWCVHDNGTKIQGTETRGNPDCSKATRPGLCPDIRNLNIDFIDEGCQSDDSCTGSNEKCCYNGFGYQCLPPEGTLTIMHEGDRNKRGIPTGCGSSGNSMKCCDVDLCVHAVCPSNPQAVCRINPCNDCAVEFYDKMNYKVDNCYAGMSTCEIFRFNILKSRPMLYWVDTTNPPWMQSVQMNAVMPMWVDTTNPPYLQSTYSLGAAPMEVNDKEHEEEKTDMSKLDLFKVMMLLYKISEDSSKTHLIGVVPDPLPPPSNVEDFAFSNVCPVLLPGIKGTCVQECERDTDCGVGKMCCSNGCGQTCQVPVAALSTEVCKLPPNTGQCYSNPLVTRVFYNQESGKCEPFLYRDGCQGNANNFLTMEACERGCVQGVPDECIISPDPGNCEGLFPMWFHNITSGRCEQFVYGGCDGNDNQFVSEQECYMTCGSSLNKPSACRMLRCADDFVCLSYNDSYAECIKKVDLIPDMDLYIPNCVGTGQFFKEQCAGSLCWCVDRDSGDFIKDTLRIGPAPCNTTDDGSQTGSSKPVCLNGKTPVPCMKSCQDATCLGYPDATCVADPCNDCSISFVDANKNPVSCGINRCSSKIPDHLDHSTHGGHIGCGNPEMRYVYNSNTQGCDGFLYTSCEGPDIFFISEYDCMNQCTGSMCSGSQPARCENTCAAASCPNYPGSLCQVDLCQGCQPVFYDPVSRQKVNCNSVSPVCQLKRSILKKASTQGQRPLFKNTGQEMDIPICDENGDFVPQQCLRNGKTCWCVDGVGNMIPGTVKSVRNKHEDINCVKKSTKSALVSFIFPEDYDVYAKGRESNFKRLIKEAAEKLSTKFKDILKSITIRKGSIIVDVELESSSSDSDTLVASHANFLESQIRKGFTIDVDGKVLTAEQDNVKTTMTFQTATEQTRSTRIDHDPDKQLILIIVIAVICGVVVLVFIIIAIYAKKKSSKRKMAKLDHEDKVQTNSMHFKNEVCDTEIEMMDGKDNINL